jgi:hypothetical protein
MSARSLSNISMIGLLLVGLLCCALRYRSRARDESSRQESIWQLTYTARFEPTIATSRQESQIRLALPFNTDHCELLRDRTGWQVADPNLHAKITRPNRKTGNRSLVVSTRKTNAKPYEAAAQFVVRLEPQAEPGRPRFEALSSREQFLRAEPNLPTTDPAVRQLAQRAPNDAQTEFERLEWVFEYCASIVSTGEKLSDDAKTALITKRGTAKARARAMATLCRVLGFPSRLVAGFVVCQNADVQPHVWVEVYQGQQWEPFDPTNGYSLTLPMNYVPMRRDSDQVCSVANVNRAKLAITCSIKRLPPDRRLIQSEMRHPTQILNLQRLPFKMHKVMKILLLLPFAALITTFLRNVVGLGTFGTFSPALLAMSFIYADWKTGLAVVLIVFTVGMLARLALERLRLLTVPRLSIILTVVIMCVVFGLSMLHYMMPVISAQVVLLPMIILTMLIERFHVSAEEDGLVHTVKLAAGTMFVAILCYLTLGSQRIGDVVLTYPELHLFTIASFIALGRYAGYRLTELWRFRDLATLREAA